MKNDAYYEESGKKNISKPVVVWLVGYWESMRDIWKVLEDGGIPVYLSPARAVKAISALYRYSSRDFSTD